jgi:thiazole synthase
MSFDAHLAVIAGEPWLQAGPHRLVSRVLLGIEQYTSASLVGKVLDASGADVFITTYDLEQSRTSLLLADLDREVELSRYAWIGTTSFACSADAAVRTAHYLRDALDIMVIKLDVRDQNKLPDPGATVAAARQLLAEDFCVLPFVPPDVQVALVLQDLGCAALRLMASPVGSYRGITDPAAMRRCIEAASVPVIVEGGIGSPAHIVQAMELGATAVLVNTLVAQAKDPVAMAAAVRHAVLAGSLAARADGLVARGSLDGPADRPSRGGLVRHGWCADRYQRSRNATVAAGWVTCRPRAVRQRVAGRRSGLHAGAHSRAAVLHAT